MAETNTETRLTILSIDGEWALCLCRCGNTKKINKYHVLNGHTSSCGCLKKELRTRLTHGLSNGRAPEYAVWATMIQRCTNPNNKGYKNYGGRGIAVCESWRHSFENFLKDMGNRPSASHSLDRFPNNDGNYEPGNCRWATKLQQANNTRANRVICFDGKEMTVAEWARHLDLDQDFLWQRLSRGWTMEECVNTPNPGKAREGKPFSRPSPTV